MQTLFHVQENKWTMLSPPGFELAQDDCKHIVVSTMLKPLWKLPNEQANASARYVVLLVCKLLTNNNRHEHICTSSGMPLKRCPFILCDFCMLHKCLKRYHNILFSNAALCTSQIKRYVAESLHGLAKNCTRAKYIIWFMCRAMKLNNHAISHICL